MEKYACKFYEELNDTVSYCLKDWLKIELSKTSEEKILMLNGAGAFLFDHLFAGQNAGRDITAQATMMTKFKFEYERLSKPALAISNKMRSQWGCNGPETPFMKYYRFIGETEKYIDAAKEDEAGRLVIAYVDELINLVCEEKKDISYLKIGEALFLNVVDSWRLAFLDLLGERFKGYPSFPFFQGVAEEFERIRSEIID